MRTAGGSSPATIQSPRTIGSLPSRPARLSAHRCPALPFCVAAFCAWIERTRADCPASTARTMSPTATSPLTTVPVTTRPAPAMVKVRSTARRKWPSRVRGRSARAADSRCAFNASTPAPLTAESANSGAPRRPVGASSSASIAFTASTRAGLTRSILVSATAPCATPSRSRIARCSRVCGIGPSSAATTSSAKSMPATPESMLCTKRSWPGTSTKPIVAASATGR
ncbi:MAG: hypothetical protein AMJ64_08290 [Betaproteobacteria bacterium SG8_39]|nr:MAG: hypothetical protein AMJ64_08290 [Betaproteobacteria bacterium SG8_39]